MATHTLTTSSALTAVTWTGDGAQLSAADLAAVAVLIKDDLNVAHPLIPGSFVKEGRLFIPNRQGVLIILPGDVIAVDSRGFPILVSKDSIANGNWTYA